MTRFNSDDLVSTNTKQLEVIAKARKLLTPTSEEAQEANALARLVLDCVTVCCEKLEIPYSRVVLVGSLAKGTWLSGDYDIDVFILFPPEEKNCFPSLVKNLGKCIPSELSKHGVKVKSLRKHSTHPYVYLFNDRLSIDIVPAVDVQSIPSEKRKILTPVDRTPLHTEYVARMIEENPDLRNEIRVFKRFLKTIGSYGSEVKTQGFSGYLTELLVIYSGSAIATIRNLAKITPGSMFQLGEKEESLDKPLEKWGDAPLYFPDPTDRSRNVASVVSPSTLSNIKLACEAFLHFPSLFFFKPLEPLPISAYSQDTLTFLKFIHIETGLLPEDRIWSQLLKNSRRLMEYLNDEGFPIIGLKPIEISAKQFLLLVFSLSDTNSALVLEKTFSAYSKESFTKFIGILRSPTRYGPRIKDYVLESWTRKPRKDLPTVLNRLIRENFFSWSKSVAPQIKEIRLINSYKQLPSTVLSSSDFLYELEELVTGIKPWMRKLRENAPLE